MAGRHQMRALGRGGSHGGAAEESAATGGEALELGPADEELALADGWIAEDEMARAPTARRGWIAAALAGLVLAMWSGFFAWAHQDVLASGAAPREWAALIGQWAVPAGLIGIVWLLAMRSSRAEAQRFAESAALLRRESEALEVRLKAVNRELSLAREFLAAEARDLETLGRLAVERISTHAAELQALIADNGAQVSAIATASEAALGNMNRLRSDLPVIAQSARDVSNQIGAAGHAAQEQLARLSEGFTRLEAASAASAEEVDGLGSEVERILAGLEAAMARIEALAQGRFATLQAEAEAYQARLETLAVEARTAHDARLAAVEEEGAALTARLTEAAEHARSAYEQAIAALHDRLVEKLRNIDELDRSTGAAASQRILALREESTRFDELLAEHCRRFDAMIAQRQAAFETQEAQASEVLAQRLAALDDALGERRAAQLAEAEQLVAQGEALTARLEALRALMAEAGAAGSEAEQRLDAALTAIAAALSDKRSALGDTASSLEQLTDSAVRLLEIIQAAARTSREDLDAAIAAAGGTLGTLETRAEAVSQLMLTSSAAGQDLSAYLHETRAGIVAAEAAMASLKAGLAADSEEALARLQGLRGGFARLAAESAALAGETQDALRAALVRLEEAIRETFATLEDGTLSRAGALAEQLGGQAVETLERALRNEAAATIGKLEQAAAHASGVAREAAIQLRDQLVKVNELTGNLEQRVARARELAEEQVNNDFARRMALITDSLNSAAIDISTALSAEIADTAWEAYLKGDRGIFTRRAVRLIDSGTAREIAGLYGSDETFRANVNRYIHDFEALLRATLSTRDGHVLSVTMLGSDMGKLYVALAQAIERLRA
ncbi:MAG: ATPase [Erythrobacter cryptus]